MISRSTWGVTFDNKFIVDVSDDKAVPEGFHGIAEDVAADGLDDIFHELRPVGSNASPFFCKDYAFVGNGFSAELVCADSQFYICKPAS